jgi:hypothetical protein
MRACQSGFPFTASNAMKFPDTSPANSSRPAVVSSPGLRGPSFAARNLCSRLPCPSCSRWPRCNYRRHRLKFHLAAQTHCPARVQFGQVIHRVVLGHGDVQQASVRTERRRRPVGCAAVVRRHERAANMMILLGNPDGLPLGVQSGRDPRGQEFAPAARQLPQGEATAS